MITRQILAIVAPTLARSVRRWIFHLGGLGFIPLGLLDSSVIPLPGSMDILTIILSARKKELWLYYALMATIGSVIGGYATYRLARKGGKETLERKFPSRTLEKVYRISGRWGLCGYRHRCLAATACAHGSISLCRRRNAIFHGKISGGAHARANCPIFSPGVPGSPLWPADAHDGHVATWTSSPHRHYWLIAAATAAFIFILSASRVCIYYQINEMSCCFATVLVEALRINLL